MKTKRRALTALTLLLALAGGFHPTPSRATRAGVLADAPLGNRPARTGPSAGADIPGEDADWWATVQENIRQSEYQVSWQEQTYLADVADLAGEVTTGAYQAPNRAQNLRTYFTAQGLVVIPRIWPEGGKTPPWRWELSLAAWGRALALEAVPPAELQAQDNRIEYQRGSTGSGQGLVEWYRNDESGLAQGFTLAAPLTETPTGEPLRFDLLVGGDLVAEVVQDGAAIECHNPDGEDGLRYSSLRAVDTEGRSLLTWLSLQGSTLSLFVDDVEAIYPIQIDLVITGLSEDWDWQLIAPDPDGVDWRLGFSVATAGDVNGDGYSDVLIGVPYYDGGQTDMGTAAIYYGSAEGLSEEDYELLGFHHASAYLGWSVAPAGDVNGDGYGDVIIGIPGWDEEYTDEGAAIIYLGSETGLDDSAYGGCCRTGDQEEEQFGWSVAPAGDVNGDGYADIIVGMPTYGNGQDQEGRTCVWHGASEPSFSQAPNWCAESNQADAMLGWSVGTAGDVNGDGYSDVIVGAPFYNNGETSEGAAFVWHGSADGLNGGVHGDPSNEAWMAQGNQDGAYLGQSVSTAGDVNGDGYADVIVGGPYFDNGQENEGAAWVFLGSAEGLDTDWVSRKESNQARAHLGQAVGLAGDVNGDGYADVIVGAPHYDIVTSGDEGRAWVWHGSATGISAVSDWRDDGDWEKANFGQAVATAGDVNGDGYSDVIVGAPGQPYAGLRGYVNVYHGGPAPLSDTAGWSRDSNQENAYFGWSVGTAGDVNGDGYADIVVGTPYWDGGQESEGGIWLYHGGADGPSATSDAHREPNQEWAGFGWSVGTAGDVNGDGYDDVIVGAPLYSGDGDNEGVAFVYHGSAGGDSLSPYSVWSQGSNQAGAQFGYAVGTAGDVNGDGYLDVIVGAPFWNNDETNEGGAWVYHGSAEGLETEDNWHVALDEAGAQFGYAVGTAGDVNGDGYSDVIAGAPSWNHGQSGEGGAWVYLGSSEGVETEDDWYQESDQADAQFGYSVGTAGDVNGDGYSDVIVGAPFWTSGESMEGRASVYHGSAGGLELDASWEREPNHASAYFGHSVGMAGDVNGDGYADVIVGAPSWNEDNGTAWVYHGTADGLHTYSDWHAEGDQADAYFGQSVGSAGDVNGDGYADVLVGAPDYGNPTDREGMVFLYYGNGGRGVSLQPRQWQAFSSASIARLGRAQVDGVFVGLQRRGPFGQGGAVPESELKPLGQRFDGTDTARWRVYYPANGQMIYMFMLRYFSFYDTLYHWRIRLWYDPVTTPWMPASRWVTVPWNGWNEADFYLPSCQVFLPVVVRGD